VSVVRDDSGCVSLWQFEDPAATAVDLMARNAGSYQGGYTKTADGVTLNGTTGYVTVPDSASLDGMGDSFAIIVQANLASAISVIRSLVSKGATGFDFRITATNSLSLAISGGSIIATGSVLSTGRHVLSAVKGGTVSSALLVDGVYSAGGSGSAVANTNLPLTIGCNSVSAGSRNQFLDQTVELVAVCNKPNRGPLVAVPWASDWPAQPSALTTWIDPQYGGTLNPAQNMSVPFVAMHGGGKLVSLSAVVDDQSGSPVYFSGALTTDAQGRGTLNFTIPSATSTARITITATSDGVNGNTSTVWQATGVSGMLALKRFEPNIALGDGVSGLGAVSALVATTPPDDVGLFYRACTGPGLSDYAAGSSWTTNLSTAQSQLPARGAYLAVQAQIVRRS